MNENDTYRQGVLRGFALAAKRLRIVQKTVEGDAAFLAPMALEAEARLFEDIAAGRISTDSW